MARRVDEELVDVVLDSADRERDGVEFAENAARVGVEAAGGVL
jgi:hypothetical protein